MASRFFAALRLEEHRLRWIHSPAALAHPLDGGAALTLERDLDQSAASLGVEKAAYHRLLAPFVEGSGLVGRRGLRSPLRVPKHRLLMARFGLAIMARGSWRNKITAGFTNSGAHAENKLATLIQFTIFAAQRGMHWVNLDLAPVIKSSKGSEQEMNRLGFWLGAASQSNVDQGPEDSPPEADLATAQHLGKELQR